MHYEKKKSHRFKGRTNNLVMLIDKSGSMSGAYMERLKDACLSLGENLLFKKDSEGHLPFHSVETIFYNSELRRYDFMNSKAMFMSHIKECKA